MISHLDQMLATDLRCAEIGNADARKRSGKRKQNKQMEKFKELQISEACEIEGGVLGFNWGMFWSGCKIGLGVGGAVGTAHYFMS